jgi:hypothetical protein
LSRSSVLLNSTSSSSQMSWEATISTKALRISSQRFLPSHSSQATTYCAAFLPGLP